MCYCVCFSPGNDRLPIWDSVRQLLLCGWQADNAQQGRLRLQRGPAQRMIPPAGLPRCSPPPLYITHHASCSHSHTSWPPPISSVSYILPVLRIQLQMELPVFCRLCQLCNTHTHFCNSWNCTFLICFPWSGKCMGKTNASVWYVMCTYVWVWSQCRQNPAVGTNALQLQTLLSGPESFLSPFDFPQASLSVGQVWLMNSLCIYSLYVTFCGWVSILLVQTATKHVSDTVCI